MKQGMRMIGCGAATGACSVSNDDLAQRMETSDEWIRSRTGIGSRFIAGADEGVVDLAEQAASRAIAAAGDGRERIDVVIVATFSAQERMPSVAAQLVGRLGLEREVLAFDLNSACTGFVQALEVARALLALRDEGRRALVIGAEIISAWVDWEDRGTAVLFGDGAGAVVMEAADTLYASVFGTQSDEKALYLRPDATGKQLIGMDGQAVFRFAVRTVPLLLQEVCDKAGLAPAELDALVCHQANARIIETVAKKLKLTSDRFFQNLDHCGNTSAASVPMALAEMVQAGLLKRGMKVALAGFGAGLTWGGIVFEW